MKDVVIVPIGFVSDHMEVVYDLDTEARALSDELGLNMIRAACVGTHPKFIAMIRELILERMDQDPERRSLGSLGASHDVCPEGCCLSPSMGSADSLRSITPLHVVPQHEFFGMGFQVHLPAQIRDIVFADVVADQRERNDQGNKTSTIVLEQ